MIPGALVHKSVLSACFLFVAVSFCSAAELRIRIGGTGSALSGMRVVAEAFKREEPETRVEVLPSLGSSGGIKALVAGELEMALSARPLRSEEIGQGLSATAYAETPFVLAAHPDCELDGLAMSQVVAIYRGTLREWPNGSPIRLILRPHSDTDVGLLKGLAPEMPAALEAAYSRSGMTMGMTDQEAADLLERLPGAFGSTTLAVVRGEKRSIKVLALDGVAPSVEALASGHYPYHKVLYLVTKPRSSDAVRRFQKFMYSATGGHILTRHGYLPSGADSR